MWCTVDSSGWAVINRSSNLARAEWSPTNEEDELGTFSRSDIDDI